MKNFPNCLAELTGLLFLGVHASNLALASQFQLQPPSPFAPLPFLLLALLAFWSRRYFLTFSAFSFAAIARVLNWPYFYISLGWFQEPHRYARLLWETRTGLFYLPLTLYIIYCIFRRPPPEQDVHGSARLATSKELRGFRRVEPSSLNNFRTPGIFIGRLPGEPALLYDETSRFLLATMPTGSGKTKSVLIPSLLSTTDASVLVVDPKGENYQSTAGWRATLGPVYRLDFTHPTIGFNPLAVLAEEENPVPLAQALAWILANPEGFTVQGENAIWIQQSVDILSAGLLHLLRTAQHRPPTIADLLTLTRSPSHYLRELDSGPDTPYSPFLKSTVAKLQDMADRTLSSVFLNVAGATDPLKDPELLNLFSANNFDPRVLQYSDAPATAYLTMKPSDLDRVRGPLKLVLTTIIQSLLRDEKQRFPLILFIDEFPALSCYKFLETALGYVRSYGIRVFLVTQSQAQLRDRYGPDHSFGDHCQIKLAGPSSAKDESEYISEMLGKRTVEYRRKTKKLAVLPSGGSLAEADTARPLMTPDEVRSIKDRVYFLFSDKARPAILEGAYFSSFPILAQRAAIPPPH